MVSKRPINETLIQVQRRLRQVQRRLEVHWRFLAGVSAAVTLTFVVGLWAMLSGLPGREELRTLGEMPQATTLYDVHNRPVFTIFKEYRIEVPLAQISPHLRKAIVAFEDQRFAEHSGIDIIRIVGAVWADVREGRKAQGGSTLTQQLARQSFLTREKKLWRKVREIALARRIERMYSKDEILELYLNKMYFGDGLHGAEAAARGYFGKSASDLDLAEAALLAGLVNAPSVNAPTVSMSRARRAARARAEHDARAGHHHRRRIRARVEGENPARRHAAPRRAARPVLQGRSAAAAREAVWLGEAVGRRTQGLHDDRSRDAARGRSEGRAVARSRSKRGARVANRNRTPTRTRSWKRRSSRWIRPPAKCARWSAAATSRPAASIARRRHFASLARRSSHSCMRRRSRPVIRRRRW